MDLRLDRQPIADGVLFGRLFVDGVSCCDTLERAEVAIPFGRYRVTIRQSEHFGRLLPHVEDVPGRAGILIHPGNVGGDTEGCILVGETHTKAALLASRIAMAHVQQPIAYAQALGHDIWLTVQPAPTEGTVSA